MEALLNEEIELKRIELITSGVTKGLTDASTVKLSKELDLLLNQLLSQRTCS